MNFDLEENTVKGYLSFVYKYSILDKEVEIKRKDLLGISEKITETAFLVNRMYSSQLRGKALIETESENLEESDSGKLTYRIEGQNNRIIKCVYGLIDQDLMPDYFIKPNIVRTTINDMFVGVLFKPKTDPKTYSELEKLFEMMQIEMPKKPAYNLSNSRTRDMI